METTAFVLLIIVSSVLVIFLAVLIIAMIYFIRFLRKADDLAESFESAAAAFRRAVAAIPFIKIFTSIAKKKRR